MSVKIAPSILSADFAELGAGVEAISTADYVHFDVMDGCFVPNISIGIPVLQSIRKRTALPIDVHLMIVQPERYVDQFCDAGADLVTCHVEADTPEKIHLALDKIHAKGKKAGVVLKPNTRAEAVLPFLDKCDIVLVMTVEPGFGGQKFMADMMPKVSAIRRYIDERNLDCELEVDGGVDAVTCKTCIEAGANVLVAGSAVYKAAVSELSMFRALALRKLMRFSQAQQVLTEMLESGDNLLKNKDMRSYYGVGSPTPMPFEYEIVKINSVNGHILRGYALLGLGRRDEAEEEIAQAAAWSPNDFRNYAFHQVKNTF